MLIKPNVLQGGFFGLFGGLTALILLLSTLMLFSLAAPQGKAGTGNFMGLFLILVALNFHILGSRGPVGSCAKLGVRPRGSA